MGDGIKPKRKRIDRRPRKFRRWKKSEPIPLDGELVRRLATIHCTDAEIATIIGCDAEALKKNYGHEIELARATGKSSIRRKQYQKAMAGDSNLLIWLGKNLLKQSDRIHTEVSFDDTLNKMSDDELRNELNALREVGEFAEDVKLKALEAPKDVIDIDPVEKKTNTGN